MILPLHWRALADVRCAVAAVMHRLGVIRIVTADADFGRAPGIIRQDPADDRERNQA